MTYKTATSNSQLAAIAAGAKAKGAKFLERMASYDQVITKKRAEIAKGLELAGLSPKDLAKQLSVSMGNFMKEFRKSTEAERMAIRQELQAAHEAAAYAREHLTREPAVATAYKIHSPERHAMEATISRMGNGALKALSDRCFAEAGTNSEENKILAACLLLAVAETTPSARPFSGPELAKAVFGKDVEQTKALLAEIDVEFQRAKLLDDSFSTGKPIDPTDKIWMGLSHGENALPHDAPKPEPKEPSSADKIAASLETVSAARSKSQEEFDAEWAENMAKLDALAAA